MRERVWLNLAESSGLPVSVLKEQWPESDFRLLLAKYTFEPLPGDRLDWWAGQLLAAAINPHRKKGARAVEARKLIPDWYKAAGPKKPQTAAGVMGMLEGFARAFGKVVTRGSGRGDAGDHADRERGPADGRPAGGPDPDRELRDG